jgi:3-methyl-2-oxobutanoate hydroxymethyltransferase
MPQPEDKLTVTSLKQKKRSKEKISCITAYDAPTARIASDAGIHLILVGDSLGMVIQGHKNTLKVTLDEVVYHTRLVSNACPKPLVVSDMPFGSFHINRDETVKNAIRLIKEGGAEAVKLEGGRGRFDVIEGILNAEIPVLGHLGLTPQSINKIGGFKLQGKIKSKANEILEDAKELEKLGVFGIVLESIPLELAREVTESINIPTIGIGAGKYCDGQILVFHDLVGYTNLYLPKFVRKYADVYTIIYNAIKEYKTDIATGNFPGDEESYIQKNQGHKK